jgi:hypothetical protein
MKNWILSLFSEQHVSSSIRTFIRCVYAWFGCFFIFYFSDLSTIWGTDSALIRYSAPDTPTNNFVYVLMYQLHWFWPIASLHLLSIVMVVFQIWKQPVFRFLVWITGVLLYFSAIPAMNSGYLFMLLLAFYLIPFQLKPKKELDYFMNRMVVFTCMLQLYFVYVFSALFKITSKQWLSGEALYYTFLNDRFSPTFLKSIAYYMPFGIIIFLAYFIMIFQLFFPLWSQWKRTRKAALWIGVMMHLWIAFVMHLWDFAFAMILPYYLFSRTEDQKTEEVPPSTQILVETDDHYGNKLSV